MPFNSDTYHANKHRRQAWANLEQARAYHAQGNAELAAVYVRVARSDMRLHLIYKSMAATKRGQRSGRHVLRARHV